MVYGGKLRRKFVPGNGTRDYNLHEVKLVALGKFREIKARQVLARVIKPGVRRLGGRKFRFGARGAFSTKGGSALRLLERANFHQPPGPSSRYLRKLSRGFIELPSLTGAWNRLFFAVWKFAKRSRVARDNSRVPRYRCDLFFGGSMYPKSYSGGREYR